MIFQSVQSRERLLALCTSEWLHRGLLVRLLMSLELGQPCEGGATCATRVRLLTSMRSHVNFQMRKLVERQLTLSTSVQFVTLVLMGLHMNGEFALLGER